MTSTVHPSVNEDALTDLAHSAYEEALSSGLSVDSFLRYFKTIAKRASQPLPLPEAEVDAILAHAERMDPAVLAQEQANFEAWANDDICWAVSSKTKNGAAYKDQATNCAWAGYIARAMTEQIRVGRLSKEHAAKPTPSIGDFDMLAAEVANDVDVKAARDWVEATFGKPHTMWLYQAAINCKHEIDKDSVVLHFDAKQPGHNALDQLARRLTAHAQARFRKDDAEQLYRAAIACRHAVTDEKVVLQFDISQDGQNALNQLSKRLIGCAKKIFGPELVS